MQDIDNVRELYCLLHKGLEEEVQFSAKIDVTNPNYILFTYEGRVSFFPIGSGNGRYELRCHEGNALFRFRQRDNADIKNPVYDCILIPLDLSDGAFMRLADIKDIKY